MFFRTFRNEKHAMKNLSDYNLNYRASFRCKSKVTFSNFLKLLWGQDWNSQRIFLDKSSVIRQKGDFKTGISRKQSTPNFPKKPNISYPWYAHVRVRILGCEMLAFSKIACFVFLKHPFWYWSFCLITDELDNAISSGLLYFLWNMN